MSKTLTVDCPCGWTMTTPHGEDDFVKHVSLHVKDVHPDMESMNREEILKLAK